ncbi:MAG: DNA-binding protein WhiA, partial [Candidatus Riflebacteria bacterium]|nr:DNA-binding protein WhiA [Candidatus Riflebacteria bacterium]
MLEYSMRIRRELLHLIALNGLQCCRQSFLVSLLQGPRICPFVKARRMLQRRLVKCLQIILPGDQSISVQGARVSLPGYDQLVLREKFVDRMGRFSDTMSAKHCLSAFLQGLFVSHGYIQNPDRGYHLEFRLRGRWLTAAFKKVAAHLRLRFCVYKNKRYCSFYMKSGRRITALLNLLGLFDRSLEFADLRATRSLLSMVNRQVNSETANINRLITAAESSISHIRELLEYEDQEIWTESLHQLAQIRMKFPHDSIEALGKRFNPPLT